MYKISFCIPTLNRGDFIAETLDSIITEFLHVDGLPFEIVIVDGGSTDRTSAVVTEYSNKYDFIRYIKPSAPSFDKKKKSGTNIGFDVDCNRAVENARGEYCWLFTDDDLIKPDSLNSVLAELRENPSLIVVNAEVKNFDLSVVLQDEVLPQKNKSFKTEEFEEFFDYCIGYATFVGSIIIKREDWFDININDYIGSGFIHLGVVFRRRLNFSATIIGRPCVTIRGGNAQWSNRAFSIGMINFPWVVNSLPDISPTVKNKYNFSQISKTLRRMLFYRARNQITFKDILIFSKVQQASDVRLLIYLIILIFPPALLNYFLRIIIRFIAPKSRLLLYELEGSNRNLKNNCK